MTGSTVPHDVKLRAKDIIRDMFRDPLAPFQPILERALMAEREWVGDQLKSPFFVRENWRRGGINADYIVAEERRSRDLEYFALAAEVMSAWPDGSEGRKAASQVVAVLFPHYMQEKAPPAPPDRFEECGF